MFRSVLAWILSLAILSASVSTVDAASIGGGKGKAEATKVVGGKKKGKKKAGKKASKKKAKKGAKKSAKGKKK